MLPDDAKNKIEMVKTLLNLNLNHGSKKMSKNILVDVRYYVVIEIAFCFYDNDTSTFAMSTMIATAINIGAIPIWLLILWLLSWLL